MTATNNSDNDSYHYYKKNYKAVKALGRITVWIVHASIVVMFLFIFNYFSIAVIRHHNQNK